MVKRTAVYVRVSTVDQNLENQLPDLKRWACANGVAVPADDTWLENLVPRHARAGDLVRRQVHRPDG